MTIANFLQKARHALVPMRKATIDALLLGTLMIGGLVTGGLSTAREWETRTVKELLLSPATGSAIITGKVLAGFITTFTLGVLVFAWVMSWDGRSPKESTGSLPC